MRKLYCIPLILIGFVALSHQAAEKTSLINTYQQIHSLVPAGIDSTPKKGKKDPIQEDIKRLLPPVPTSFSSTDSARLIARWTIGIKLYKANCAKCHGIFGDGKDSIPNFSKEQMDDYKGNLLAQDKSNHAAMANMTVDELEAVFLFISNLKREE